jgi:hypothetical protein
MRFEPEPTDSVSWWMSWWGIWMNLLLGRINEDMEAVTTAMPAAGWLSCKWSSQTATVLIRLTTTAERRARVFKSVPCDWPSFLFTAYRKVLQRYLIQKSQTSMNSDLCFFAVRLVSFTDSIPSKDRYFPFLCAIQTTFRNYRSCMHWQPRSLSLK